MMAVDVLGVTKAYRMGGATVRQRLNGWKAWLAANDAVVMAVLMTVIGVKLLGDGLSGLVG